MSTDPRTLAQAALPHIPSSAPLTVAGPDATVDLGAFAGAAKVDVVGRSGSLVILVAEDVTAALQGTPMGDLSVAEAVQQAFDAAAQELGEAVGPANNLDVEDLAAAAGAWASCPLVDANGNVRAAFLVSEPLLGGPVPKPSGARGLEMLHGVVLDVTVELGRTRMSVRELLEMAPGDVLELDRAAGSPADLLVNQKLIARGEVVVVDEDFGLRITEVLDPQAGV